MTVNPYQFLTIEEKQLFERARVKALNKEPSIEIYNIRLTKNYEIMYRYKDNIPYIYIKDLLEAFDKNLAVDVRYLHIYDACKLVTDNLSDFIALISYICNCLSYDNVEVLDVNNIQRFFYENN